MPSSGKTLYADILFPELEKELARQKPRSKVKGLFKVTILKRGEKSDRHSQEGSFVRVVIEDSDMLKMITGGLNGVKAYTHKKLLIEGDLVLASQVEEMFVSAGGVKKVMSYIRSKYPSSAFAKSTSKL